MDGKLNIFIEEATRQLQDLAKRMGYAKISRDTIRLIAMEYCKKYNPPQKRGTNVKPTLPPMFYCTVCTRYKPRTQMMVIKPNGKTGFCKNCDPSEDNVHFVDFKNKRKK